MHNKAVLSPSAGTAIPLALHVSPKPRRYSKAMKELIFVFLAFISVSAFAEDELNKSLGLIILENDRLVEVQTGYRYQVPDIFPLIATEYDRNIKNLDPEKRVAFYRSLTLHLDLSDHEILDLAKLIKDYCASEYMSMASKEAKKYKEGRSLSYKARRLAAVAKLLTYNKAVKDDVPTRCFGTHFTAALCV